jgi:quercetin dioxygenase-like cupin family protein
MISHVVLRKRIVKRDWKLVLPTARNNGRKYLVKELYGDSERPIGDPEWQPGTKYTGVPLPEDEKTPVLVTGDGGTEIATFTEKANQDRHQHHVSMETYTVLKGVLRILINDEGPLELSAGDEVIIRPGTVHEIVTEMPARERLLGWFSRPALIVRVHATQCYGETDKYVQLERGGEWRRLSDLPKDQRKSSYKKERG